MGLPQQSGSYLPGDIVNALTALAHASREANGEYRRGYLAALHDVAVSIGARFATPPQANVEDVSFRRLPR